MTDNGRGSYANQIDPEGGIKAPALSPVFERANDNRPPAEQAPSTPSAQVANTELSPREPSPSFGYDQAKAVQHKQAMRADDLAVKRASLKAKAQLFGRQDAARKAKGMPSLGQSLRKDRGRERGDD